MAKLTAHGGLRMLFNGDRVSFGGDHRHPFQFRALGRRRLVESEIGYQSRRGRVVEWSGRVCSLGRKTSNTRSSIDGEEGFKDDDDVADDDYDEEFVRDELSCFRGLVLDISYRPVNVVCWKRAICLEFMEKADVLEYYDQTVSSPQGSFYIPAVLRVPHLLQVMKRRRVKYNLSRKSIFYRDNYTCQYCSSHENLTIDHVLPISRGGEWKWENLVAACAKCNSKKGQKTVEEANMKLMKTPKTPKDFDILAIPLTSAAVKSLKMRKGVPEEWLQYLSKPSP